MTARRSWFGPSRKQIWQDLCARVGGTYTAGGLLKGDRVEVSHRDWTVTLDAPFNAATKTTDTRLRAPYRNPEGFRFTIYRRGLFSDLAVRLGMQDIAIGHPEFDREFVIKGTHEDRVITLFANPEIRRLLELQPKVFFSVDDDEGWFGSRYPEHTDGLRFTVTGTVRDTEQLKLLFDLFAETLDELCRMGSAYEDGPDVTLK
jgi:hypothetical protein